MQPGIQAGTAPESQRRMVRFSTLLIAGGAILLLLGALDFLGSIWGQREAEREWRSAETIPPAAAAPDLGAAFAKMSIPRLGAVWFVYEGADAGNLRLGPAHLRGTALPGMAGNCVIAGHRDTHFRVLKDIRAGDEILVQTRRGEFRYAVTGTRVVNPSNTQALKPTARPVMNLITCYPFYYVGPAPKRFVVETQLRPAS